MVTPDMEAVGMEKVGMVMPETVEMGLWVLVPESITS